MTAHITELRLYPVKGCRGIRLDHAVVASTGLEFEGIGDREWVIADADGEFLSQRELPKMALIETRLSSAAMTLKAPGMLQLEVPFESEGDVVDVKVWNDDIKAVTQGDVADAWLSNFLGQPSRLLRFDPEHRRLANRRFTGVDESPYKFADAFPLLIASVASLADVNAKLARKGIDPVGIERFRPNVIVDGVDAFEEDYIDQLAGGDFRLRCVKPCVRCTVPSVDPATGIQGVEPGDTLATYRNLERAGGISFGVNAIVLKPGTASVGMPVDLTLAL